MTNEQLGLEVALCSKAIISCMIECVNVVLSEGRDLGAMAAAGSYLDMVSELKDRLEVTRRAEGGED